MKFALRQLASIGFLALTLPQSHVVYAQKDDWMKPYLCKDGEFCRMPVDCEEEDLSEKQCKKVKSLYEQSRHRGAVVDDAKVRTNGLWQSSYRENTERLLPTEVFTLWLKHSKEDVEQIDQNTKVVYQKSVRDKVETVKLSDLVENIQFVAGESNIPEEFVEKLREVLNGMGSRENVRLHFVGHTDSDTLSGEAKDKYGDNLGLSKSRAEETALYFQEELRLPSSSISYEGKGDSEPLASNSTASGKALNRRVAVEVWYDELTEEEFDEAVIARDDVTRRIEVCRVQERCVFKRRAGVVKKAQIRHSIKPLSISEERLVVPREYMQNISRLLNEYSDREGVQLRFVGHTDNAPLTETQKKIYGNHVDFSKSVAQRVSQLVVDALRLSPNAVSFDGKGGVRPIATNLTTQGRALNKRIEVEVWYDIVDDQQALQAQACPDDGGAEIVDILYEGEKPVVQFKDGKPVYTPGLDKRIERILLTLKDKSNLRMHFVGHTSNASLTRRQASIYPDHEALSNSRAKIVMKHVKGFTALERRQYIYEGRGFVEPVGKNKSIFDSKVFSVSKTEDKGAANPRDDRVEIEFRYDELAVLDQDDDIEIVRVNRHENAVSPYALLPIRISVDGNSIDGTRVHDADVQRCTDVALEKANVQLQYDSQKIEPKLHVDAVNAVVWYEDNIDTQEQENRLEFVSYTNYAAFIDKAEIRIFNPKQSLRSEPLAVIELDKNGYADFQLGETYASFDGPKNDWVYILRVYADKDDLSIFDETEPKTFWVTRNQPKQEKRSVQEAALAIYGRSSLKQRRINLSGGTVSVYGENIPADHQVWVFDQDIPVSDKQDVVIEQILPSGQHSVEVAVLDSEGSGNLFVRNLELKQKSWFTVGIADLTIGKDDTNGPAALVTNDNTHFENEIFSDGRLAFYTKGETKSGYKITASVDTGEVSSEDLFSNFSDKNPDYLFRRLDQDYHYSTFGDDSETVDDAPTQGKVYAKVEKKKSFALLGNFKTDLLATDLTQVDRGLYGIQLHGESEAGTRYGESKHELDAFIADPGTLSARDEFRGTGGSLYFLNRRDLTQGSERLRIEIRDKDSDIVLSSRDLIAAQDYDLDYIQGRVILTEPLTAVSDDNVLIQSGSFSGHPVYLVARYEYSPAFVDLDDAAAAIRYSNWLNDRFQIGFTASSQELSASGTNESVDLGGIDLTYRKSLQTYFKLESASSSGGVSDTSLSNDGGLNFSSVPLNTSATDSASSYRLEFAAKLNELFSFEKDRGTVNFYSQSRDAGFSAPGQSTNYDTEQIGFASETPISTRWKLKTKYDSNAREGLLETDSLEVNAEFKINQNLRLDFGGRSDNRDDTSGAAPSTQTQGRRTDIAAQIYYDPRDKWSAYAFTQFTADASDTRDDNDRLGVGGDYLLNPKTIVNAEVSGGDAGAGGTLGVNYKLNESSRVYLSHRVDNERDISGVLAKRGNSTLGFNSRYTDNMSVYGEERYAFGQQPSGITHAYGVDYVTDGYWSFGGGFEFGELEDNATSAKTERQAMTLSAQRQGKKFNYRGVLETRNDKTDVNTNDFLLFKNDLKVQLSPSWRLLGKYYLSDNENSLGEFYEGDFSEFSIGYAYRPIKNDRLNILFKYTNLENRPTIGQLAQLSSSENALQKSQVYALDINYDLTRRWTIGAKLATRIGEVALDRSNPVFIDNNADLLIVRADWHVVRYWDLLLEARSLSVEQARDERKGGLVAVYRHFGENIKFGGGYNFTDFSDDLTDLDFDSEGFFINIIGKL